MHMTRTKIFSLAGLALALALSSCGTTGTSVQRDSQPTEFTTPYAIVTNEADIKLWTKCDSVWIPTEEDIKPIYMALRKYLDTQNSSWSVRCDRYYREGYSFVSKHLDQYHRQYAGVFMDRRKQIFCSMYFTYFVNDRPRQDVLTCMRIMDGGATVVDFYYDIEKQEVVCLGWNTSA